ncbi:MAG: hypothetical protein ILO36_03470 [Abditibacteriota bacterium]|nr:hypothetical protein [Abditibacteriota bacterium]
MKKLLLTLFCALAATAVLGAGSDLLSLYVSPVPNFFPGLITADSLLAWDLSLPAVLKKMLAGLNDRTFAGYKKKLEPLDDHNKNKLLSSAEFANKVKDSYHKEFVKLLSSGQKTIFAQVKGDYDFIRRPYNHSERFYGDVVARRLQMTAQQKKKLESLNKKYVEQGSRLSAIKFIAKSMDEYRAEVKGMLGKNQKALFEQYETGAPLLKAKYLH